MGRAQIQMQQSSIDEQSAGVYVMYTHMIYMKMYMQVYILCVYMIYYVYIWYACYTYNFDIKNVFFFSYTHIYAYTGIHE